MALLTSIGLDAVSLAASIRALQKSWELVSSSHFSLTHSLNSELIFLSHWMPSLSTSPFKTVQIYPWILSSMSLASNIQLSGCSWHHQRLFYNPRPAWRCFLRQLSCLTCILFSLCCEKWTWRGSAHHRTCSDAELIRQVNLQQISTLVISCF